VQPTAAVPLGILVERCELALISESVNRLIDEFAKLPGIGKKTAERLAYHTLRVHKNEALALADAIRDVKENVRYCSVCYHLAERELCSICSDPRRDASLLCVIERPVDILSVEKAGSYRGKFHVLGGKISPMNGVEPEDLRIAELESARLRANALHGARSTARFDVRDCTVAGQRTALLNTRSRRVGGR
jgi:recombination protein RecR